MREFLEAARDATEGLLVEEFINGTVMHIDGFVTGGSTRYLLSAYERAPHRSAVGSLCRLIPLMTRSSRP